MSMLRDMLDKALKERDTAIRERDNWRALCEAAGEDYLSTRAELVKAQKDAKRYRWLRRDVPYDECAAVFDKHSGAELDAAIDDAMSREET
jgi:hypothetical protein